MAPPPPGKMNREAEAEAGTLHAPANPKGVTVEIGVRWAAVTWQRPHSTPDRPVEDYLLAISPGQQTIRFDGKTTQTVLIALTPGQPYTIFVAARNAAGSSGWVSSPPIELDYTITTPAQRHSLINAELFEDLLLLNDAALSDWLAEVDDIDLELAIAATPPALHERIFACIRPPERASMLRERLAPPLPVQIVRRSEVLPPPMPQPMMPRPEVVIEIPPSRPRRRWTWALALVSLLLIAAALFWSLRSLWPAQENADLKATVDALVAVRLTTEATPAQTPVARPTDRPALSMPAMASPTPEPLLLPVVAGAPPTALAPAVYAEPSVELLNVRSGPGEVYDVQEILQAGTALELQSRSEDGNWVYVATDNAEGWVASWLLTIVGDPSDLAVRLAPPTPTPSTTLTLSPTVVAEVRLDSPLQTLVADPVMTTALVMTATPVITATTSLSPALSSSVPAAPPVTDVADSPCLLGGHFWLIHPVETTVYNQVSFRWGFSAPLPKECGFEVSVWRVGGSPSGVHDAVADNKNGVVKLLPQNQYRLDVPFMHNLPSVVGSGDYFWTVSIVEIDPGYRSFNRSATPSRFYLDLPSH